MKIANFFMVIVAVACSAQMASGWGFPLFRAFFNGMRAAEISFCQSALQALTGQSPSSTPAAASSTPSSTGSSGNSTSGTTSGNTTAPAGNTTAPANTTKT